MAGLEETVHIDVGENQFFFFFNKATFGEKKSIGYFIHIFLNPSEFYLVTDQRKGLIKRHVDCINETFH